MGLVLIRNNSHYPNYTKREGYYWFDEERYVPLHQFSTDTHVKVMEKDIVGKYFKVREVDIDSLEPQIRQQVIVTARRYRVLNIPDSITKPWEYVEAPDTSRQETNIEKENNEMIKLGKEFVNEKGTVVRFDADFVEKPKGLVGVKTSYTISSNGKSLEELDSYPNKDELMYLMLKYGVSQVRVDKRYSLEFAKTRTYVYCLNEDGSKSCYENTLNLNIEVGDRIRVESGDADNVRIVSEVENTYEERSCKKVVGKCLCSMFG